VRNGGAGCSFPEEERSSIIPMAYNHREAEREGPGFPMVYPAEYGRPDSLRLDAFGFGARTGEHHCWRRIVCSTPLNAKPLRAFSARQVLEPAGERSASCSSRAG